MKNHFLKKLIAVVLSIAVICAIPLSAVAAATEADPLIYIADISESALYNTKTGEDVLNQKSASFLSPATHIIAGVLLYDSELGSKATGLQLVNKGINSMFGSITCADNGVPEHDNVGPWEYNLPLSYYEDDNIINENLSALFEYSNGAVDKDNTYIFTYDWRLDPAVAAEKFVDFIENVKAQKGCDKVDVIAAGYGGIIANTYLYYYGEHAQTSVDSLVFLNSELLGSSIIGDIMKGELYKTVLDQESFEDMYAVITNSYRGDAFMSYLQQDPNGIISGIFTTLLGDDSYVNAIGYLFSTMLIYILSSNDVGQSFGEMYNKFLASSSEEIYETSLKKYIRNMPGIWALVPEDDYEDAMDFMYGDEIIDEEFLDTLASYRTVRSATNDTLVNAQSAGIKINMVVGYNIQILPLTATVNELSDGIASVKYASVGATTTDLNDFWDCETVCQLSSHNHTSPDGDIDASTCALPENTWFIQNLPHLDYSCKNAVEFLVWLVSAEEQYNVWQNNAYPQYLKYSPITETISAYSDNTQNADLADLTKGDVNRDGVINSADARLALRYAVGLEGEVTKVVLFLADVVGNDGVNSADARHILRYAVGLETKI